MEVCTCHVLCNISWGPKWKKYSFQNVLDEQCMYWYIQLHTGTYVHVHHLDSCQVRYRTSTYDIVRSTYDIVRRTYDVVLNIVRTISYVRCYLRHRTYQWIRCRTFLNIVGGTYDIVGWTYDIVCPRKCISYTISYVHKNIRHRRYEISCRIRCRRCISYTMS